MTSCKVRLYGLKPCDIICSTADNEPDPSLAKQVSPKNELDFLHVDLKALVTPTNDHESSPIRVIMRETTRGRHRICVSQTLLRTHAGEVE